MADDSAPEYDELVYEAGGLPRTTNWWGAFVIGLAGTILVTGIAPVMVTELGAASVPVIVFITITGYIVCLLLAELSAMMPDRSGGSALLRLPGLQGPLAALRRARQRLHRVGVLARVVPGGAAEHDPGVVLHRRPLQPLDRRVHADQHPDRVVDARDLGRRPAAAGDSGRDGPAVRHGVRDDARAAVDDPADVPRDLMDLQSRRPSTSAGCGTSATRT